MKKQKLPLRLFKVEWTHVDGYHAPYSFVEAETREEAEEFQRQTKTRLMDFPESWRWKLLRTSYIWLGRRNRWIDEGTLPSGYVPI